MRFMVIFVQLALLQCCIAKAHASNIQEPFKWPHGAKAAVSLSYDDALDSQLDNAIPTLNKYNLKASFYLTLSNETPMRRVDEWRTAAKRGHELGNHTLFHQCSRTAPGHEWVEEKNNLDNVSVAQLTQQILLANSFLHAIDGKTERTFTAPCFDLKAKGEDYLPAVKNQFIAIKANVGGVIENMNTLDPYSVGVIAPSNVNGQLLIALVQAAAQKGTMVNILFHGIGGDYITTSKEAHNELVKYLYDNKDIYWTDSFINIMKYVKENQKK